MSELTGRPEYLLIRDMPSSERPRERLKEYGPRTLTASELLALIWRTGTAKESVLDLASKVLSRFGSLEAIGKASIEDLCAIHGIGEAKAIELKAAIELGKRIVQANGEERLTVRSPADIANFCMVDMALYEQEHLWVFLLNMKNQMMYRHELYRGSLNRSVVRVAEVFREAIRQSAASIVVVHNHPSGDPTPSVEDVRITGELLQAGKLLDIELLDHVVIGAQRYVSMKERGMGFGG